MLSAAYAATEDLERKAGQAFFIAQCLASPKKKKIPKRLALLCVMAAYCVCIWTLCRECCLFVKRITVEKQWPIWGNIMFMPMQSP